MKSIWVTENGMVHHRKPDQPAREYVEAQQQPDAELLEALKKCLSRIEELRLVDLGALRDAEMQDYQERKVMARRELSETNELINKINEIIARTEKKV